MRILVDTNILARIAQPGHQHHTAAVEAVERLLAQSDDPCIVPQIIYEFWVIATRPIDANGLGMSVQMAQAELSKSRSVFTLLRDERAIYSQWKRLVFQHNVLGKSAHDARLVAAMNRHGLTHVLTFNAPDFQRYPGIQVIKP